MQTPSNSQPKSRLNHSGHSHNVFVTCQTSPVMERTTFLKNYRLRLKYDGSPYEPDRSGPAISYEAVDERTGEPVSVTLIPAESVDPADREAFEEHVSSVQKLRHVNVAKVLDFGREGDDYVYVSEQLAGETLASWVRNHGPMPVDAALRVGEQIVSVLSSAGFHKLPYPSIQPSDIMLVPGQTAEGGWPLVKVTNFGLPALVARPEPQVPESDAPPQAAQGQQVGSHQQFQQPTRDIGSEIYSLGVTLYFLFTGVALSAEALQHGPKLTRFPKPLRAFLSRLLHRDPDQRPKDLLIVTEMIRQSLEKIERRRALSQRYGVPLRTTVPPPKEARPRRLVRSAVALGALLVLAAIIAPVVFPDPFGKLIRGSHKPKAVGVLVGVPEASPAAAEPQPGAQVPQNTSTTAPAVVAAQPVNPTVQPENQPMTKAATSPNPYAVRPANVQQAQIANAQKPAAVSSTDSAQDSAAATPDRSVSASTDASSAAQANRQAPPSTANQPTSQTKQKSVASKSGRARAGESSQNSSGGRSGSVRSRVVGITSDGRLILRLPSGRTAIVAPDEDNVVPRHRGRVLIDRDEMFGPPPGFGPDYSPGD
jgi:serine/threonine protein kinase